jgi:hypothetical protein
MAGLRSSLPAKKRATDPRWVAGHARVPIAELRQAPTVPCDVVGGFTPWQLDAQAAPVAAAPTPVVAAPPAAPAISGASEPYFVALIDFEVRKKESAGEAWGLGAQCRRRPSMASCAS